MSQTVTGDPRTLRAAASSIRSRANDISTAANGIAASYRNTNFSVPRKGNLDQLAQSIVAASRQLVEQAQDLEKQLTHIATQLEQVGK